MDGRPYLKAVLSWLGVLALLLLVLFGLRLALPTAWGVLARATGLDSGPLAAAVRIAAYLVAVATLLICAALALRTRSGSRLKKWFVEVNQATFWRE
jgi:hypothetical protein